MGKFPSGSVTTIVNGLSDRPSNLVTTFLEKRKCLYLNIFFLNVHSNVTATDHYIMQSLITQKILVTTLATCTFTIFM